MASSGNIAMAGGNSYTWSGTFGGSGTSATSGSSGLMGTSGSSGTLGYNGTGGLYSGSYYSTDPLDNLISHIFSLEEKRNWLIENGYRDDAYWEFNNHVRAKFKNIMLAPKIKLSVKLPNIN